MSVQKYHQIIDGPPKSIRTVLPFTLRKKILTEQVEEAKHEYHQLRKKHRTKKWIENNIKFASYQLCHASKAAKEGILKMLDSKIKVSKLKNNHLELINERMLVHIKESITAISYQTSRYQFLLQKLHQILQQFLLVTKKNVLIAVGEISGQYYVFFENCFEQPYSLCCNTNIFLKMSVGQNYSKSCILKKNLKYEIFEDIMSLKTQFICSKCGDKILQFYGFKQGTIEPTLSPKKIQNLIQFQRQRKKVHLSVMIGSGKFKRYRLDSPSGIQVSSLSQRFDAQQIFSQKTIEEGRAKSFRLKRFNLISQKKDQNIDFLFKLS